MNKRILRKILVNELGKLKQNEYDDLVRYYRIFKTKHQRKLTRR